MEFDKHTFVIGLVWGAILVNIFYAFAFGWLYSHRYDFDGDGEVTMKDLSIMAHHINVNEEIK